AMLWCVAVHASQPGGAAPGGRPGPPALLAPVSGAADVGRELAEGADLIDVTGLAEPAGAANRAGHPGAPPWTAVPPPAGDADGIAAGAADSLAGVVAAAAISTWLGAPAIRTRHIGPVRRAIDMTLSIAGDRLPAITTRGLG